MSVQEQMPIVVYVANGNTNRFAITFDLHDQNYLVVTLNNEVAQVGSYSVLDGEVVFGTAPADGSLVALYRDTQLNRTTDYKSYDNSFRPESVNWDFDKLWYVLQEQNLIDGKILARIKDEIEWRRTHDFNYDELAQVREKQLFDALKGYADTLYSATNPNVFAGVIAGVVFARDGKSIQTHIEEILDNLAVSREDIDSKAGQQYVDDQLNLKANSSDVYLKSQTYNKSETYSNTEVDTKFSAYVGGRKGYTTLALAQADQANLAANTVVEVTNDGANNGTYQWNGTTLTKSVYDPLMQAKNYTDSSVENVSIKLDDSVDIKINGGDLYYANTLLYKIDGYINPVGEFVSSTAGYKTTDFIPIQSNKKLIVSVNASTSVAAVSFWDENKIFISAVTSNNNPAEVEITPPPNAKFIRSSSNTSLTPNAYIYAVFDPLLDDPSLIKKDKLTIEYSQNLAKPSLIVDGAYVNSSGGLTTAAGWKYIKIPVEAGKTYTFGNFVIDSAGYYVFFTAANGQISGSNDVFQNTNLPKTVTAPAGAAYLLIDIARPTNTADQHSQLTVNEGSTLIDYVEPVDVVTKIAGYKLAGVSSGGGGEYPLPENVVVQGGNATLADIIADSLTTGALIANLPTSSAGLETGQAYIDTATATIKVVM